MTAFTRVDDDLARLHHGRSLAVLRIEAKSGRVRKVR
jgi:hypothetical protein